MHNFDRGDKNLALLDIPIGAPLFRNDRKSIGALLLSPVFLVAVVAKRVIACRGVLEVCSKGFEVAL